MRTATWFFMLALLCTLAACAAQLRVPSPEDAARASQRWDGFGDREMAMGHRLYILKCSSCHTLYRPEAYSESQWNELFPEMSEEARLTHDEEDLILKYLIVMATAESSL